MNALKKLIAAGVLSALLAPFFYGCGGSNEGTAEKESTDTSKMESAGMHKSSNKTQNIFYSIPSPIELAQLIQKAGAAYNKDLLNPI